MVHYVKNVQEICPWEFELGKGEVNPKICIEYVRCSPNSLSHTCQQLDSASDYFLGFFCVCLKKK